MKLNTTSVIVIISSVALIGISTPLSAEETFAVSGRSKTFGEITIPEEVTPTPMELPRSMQPDSGISILKVHLFEANPLRRIAFSQIKFLAVDVDEELLEVTRNGHISALTGSSNGTCTTREEDFAFPDIRGKKTLVNVSGTNPAVFVCYQFSDKKSIWLINFIGAGDGAGIIEYANYFMEKVSFVGEN